ncbi:MAG TPA: class I SAM-dependent methyltransferase [Mycobacteriales bacterium]|nr:class I SAM-dependent methyltransferase [Mycobacteriales bacterium]
MSRREPAWESFAQDQPEHYIWTSGDPADPDFQEQFAASGRQQIDIVLRATATYRTGGARVVEYGCGLGRMLLPMSEHFDRALGVDIAPTMLDGLRRRAADAGITTIDTALSSEPWAAGVDADLLYCWAVLQHIPSWRAISEAVETMASALRPETGVGYLHFDTRPRTPLYLARFAVPDPLLPHRWRKSIRRIRRRPAAVRALLHSCGLTVVAEQHEAADHHAFIVKAPRR